MHVEAAGQVPTCSLGGAGAGSRADSQRRRAGGRVRGRAEQEMEHEFWTARRAHQRVAVIAFKGLPSTWFEVCLQPHSTNMYEDTRGQMIVCGRQVENPSVKRFGNLQTPRHLREGLGTVTVKAQRQKRAGGQEEANITDGERPSPRYLSGERL